MFSLFSIEQDGFYEDKECVNWCLYRPVLAVAAVTWRLMGLRKYLL